MSALWNENKTSSALEKERAAQRLDCFLSILYLYPNCIDVKDMDLLAKRETELNSIFKYSARGFLGLYFLGFAANFAIRKGTMPYFKDVVMHSILGVFGTFGTGYLCEKVAAEFYYN